MEKTPETELDAVRRWIVNELDDAKARVQREACAAVLRAFGVTRSNGGDGAAPPTEPPAADGLAKGGTASRATVAGQ